MKGPRVGALAVRMFLFSNVGFFPGGQDTITASPCVHYAQAKFSFMESRFQYQLLWTTAYLLPFREVFFNASTFLGK